MPHHHGTLVHGTSLQMDWLIFVSCLSFRVCWWVVVALVQEAAGAAPAVHGELIVEAVGEAAAGAQLPPSHCRCGILLPSSTIVTSSYIFTPGHLYALGWGLGGEWQLVLGGGWQPGPGRARPGARDVAGGRVAGQKHCQHQ